MTNIILYEQIQKDFCTDPMEIQTNSRIEQINCYHCGDNCSEETLLIEDKAFCCNGCKTVFEILSQNELCNYYDLEKMPGINMSQNKKARFEYLDEPQVIEKLIDYQDERLLRVQFFLPQIHCSACLWLLENLYQVDSAIVVSRVNFLKKELSLSILYNDLSLRQVIELLSSLGYEPKITLNDIEAEKARPLSRKLIYQLGLAAFTFGNIMLLSLPEYLGLDPESYKTFSPWFGWINLALATPVAFYSGQDYFKSAWKSIGLKRLNIDVPIALGVAVLYLRSSYEIIFNLGAGYFDSLCGLLFFLLLGRLFQQKVYHQLSFERDYRSYFPISISRINEKKEENIPINDIQKGDRILVRNGELIPVDSYLIKGKARIDNSFATGEIDPIKKQIGDKIYAGGRQIGEAIQLEAIRPLNQSKLTNLWSEYAERDQESNTFSLLTDKISHWFTPIILFIALFSGAYHWQYGIGAALEVVSAVLIIACPCALALAAPFTFGHASRWLGKQGFYLRTTTLIEKLADINQVIFDKTGTLTYGHQQKVIFTGRDLDSYEQMAVWNLLNQSNHALSRLIKASLRKHEMGEVIDFKEWEGNGIEGIVNGNYFRIGSAKWIGTNPLPRAGTHSFLEKDGKIIGCFSIENSYRKGLSSLLKELAKKYKLALLSGDNDHQKERLIDVFPNQSPLLFSQSPKQKLNVIKSFQREGQKIMMVGDGLNDAGALKEAEVGIVIAEDVNSFSPACDAILKADNFNKLAHYLAFAKASKKIVIISFIISFLYNLVGLYFAVQGLLSPVFAAILMPLSSISVVGFVSLAVWWLSFRIKVNSDEK